MDDFEFLSKIKEIENKRIKKLLKKDPKALDQEMVKTFKKIEKKNVEMVEEVELVKTEEFII